jgi:hypothetical protein
LFTPIPSEADENSCEFIRRARAGYRPSGEQRQSKSVDEIDGIRDAISFPVKFLRCIQASR